MSAYPQRETTLHMHDPSSQDRDDFSSASSLSEAFMICQEAGHEAEQQQRQMRGLQPLFIADQSDLLPFTQDPGNGQSPGASQDMIDADGASGPFHQLNLASPVSRSMDESCELSTRSPTFSTLSRSQSEMRASPLRNYYANACRGRFSEGFSTVVSAGMVSPRPASPSTSVLHTPPLSARMHSAPIHADFGVPRRAKTMPRLGSDTSSDRTATVTRALSQRLQSKLDQAQGEPLTPYLM